MADTSQLLITIIPLAWAAAVSPFVLSIFLVMVSLTEDPRLSAFSFYLGAISVLLITVFIGILLGQSLENTGNGNPAVIGSIDLFLGAILILIGIRNIFSKGRERSGVIMKYVKVDPQASTISKFIRFFLIGLLAFLINFSTAIFVLAAGREIGLAKAGLLPDFWAILVLTIITLVIIEIPLLFFFLLPKTAEKTIQPMHRWIDNNGNYLTAAFLLFIGALIIYNGLGKLGTG
jgi:threonine/homoserine/homoserine lactone efflux protein